MALSCECGGDLVLYKTDSRATGARCVDCEQRYEIWTPPEKGGKRPGVPDE